MCRNLEMNFVKVHRSHILFEFTENFYDDPRKILLFNFRAVIYINFSSFSLLSRSIDVLFLSFHAKRVINNRDRYAFALRQAGHMIHRSSLIILTFTRLAAASARCPLLSLVPSFFLSLLYFHVNIICEGGWRASERLVDKTGSPLSTG